MPFDFADLDADTQALIRAREIVASRRWRKGGDYFTYRNTDKRCAAAAAGEREEIDVHSAGDVARKRAHQGEGGRRRG